MASVRASEWTFIMDTDDTFPPSSSLKNFACLVSRACSFGFIDTGRGWRFH